MREIVFCREDIQYHMVSPAIIHTSKITKTEQAVLTYLKKGETMNLKESKEGYMSGFGGQEREGKNDVNKP